LGCEKTKTTIYQCSTLSANYFLSALFIISYQPLKFECTLVKKHPKIGDLQRFPPSGFSLSWDQSLSSHWLAQGLGDFSSCSYHILEVVKSMEEGKEGEVNTCNLGPE
jgi:hypothetical protein